MKKSISLICIVISIITMLVGCNTSMTMEEYVQKHQSEYDEMSKSKDDEMISTIFAEDNTLYFRYQFLTDLGDNALAKETLENDMAAQESVMENTVKEFAAEGIQDPVLIIEYLDKDGEMITSFTFTQDDVE